MTGSLAGRVNINTIHGLSKNKPKWMVTKKISVWFPGSNLDMYAHNPWAVGEDYGKDVYENFKSALLAEKNLKIGVLYSFLVKGEYSHQDWYTLSDKQRDFIYNDNRDEYSLMILFNYILDRIKATKKKYNPITNTGWGGDDNSMEGGFELKYLLLKFYTVEVDSMLKKKGGWKIYTWFTY